MIALVAAVALAACGEVGGDEPDGEWRYFGGDRGFQRYSPLDLINHDNVHELEILWRRPAIDPAYEEDFPDVTAHPYLRSTPIMVDGRLYAPNGIGLIEAFDPETGETLWRQDPWEPTREEVSGSSMRGVDHWTDGASDRLVVVRGQYLYTLDPENGAPHLDFGDDGRVHLSVPPRGDWNGRFSWSSGPIVVGDVIVVGGVIDGAGDSGFLWKDRIPEDVRGYDVRTGELLWTFHVVPREGEFGYESWGNGSADRSGDLGSWCCLSADEELGIVYVPLSAPTAAYYGGHRPGENLFSNSLVALDARTGERVWHFQMVHHDLWEYDNQGPPTLGEIVVDGERVQVVMQPSKTGFLYVFDRVNGEPVWPIEQRPVPGSTVPGELAWPSQPHPTKPPPFDRQGVTRDDVIDFTPELRARALEILEDYVLGPIFTPPSLVNDEEGGKRGTYMVPGSWGAGNWNTGAFDPETGVYYAISHTMPSVYRLEEPPVPEESDFRYWSRHREPGEATIDGLPLVKPPYGRITALDLNRGEELWMVANGDGPRDHPLLEDLELPPLGVAGRPVPLVTRTLLFVGEGSDALSGVRDWGPMFRAYDKATGEVIWEVELPAGTTSQPITYLHQERQYIVVPIGGREHPPEWIAVGIRD